MLIVEIQIGRRRRFDEYIVPNWFYRMQQKLSKFVANKTALIIKLPLLVPLTIAFAVLNYRHSINTFNLNANFTRKTNLCCFFFCENSFGKLLWCNRLVLDKQAAEQLY